MTNRESSKEADRGSRVPCSCGGLDAYCVLKVRESVFSEHSVSGVCDSPILQAGGEKPNTNTH